MRGGCSQMRHRTGEHDGKHEDGKTTGSGPVTEARPEFLSG
jgi:hypothetical protein